MRRVVRLRGAAYPLGAGLSLSSRLRRMLGGAVWRLAREHLLPAMAADEQGDRFDQLTPGVRRALDRMSEELAQAASDVDIDREVLRTGRDVDSRHRREQSRALRKAVGVDVFVTTDGEAQRALTVWGREASALIRSVRDSAIPGIEAEVREAVAAGLRHEELAKRWRKRGLPLEFGTLEGRASVIARDQVGKLNGRLTEARHREMGVTHYVWRTAGDQRVRRRHRPRNGRRFPWAGAPADGHPGQPVQCRCTAEAVIDLDGLLGQPNVMADARRVA